MQPLKQSLNNTASNYNQPERRLTPRGRSAVVESFRNGLLPTTKTLFPFTY